MRTKKELLIKAFILLIVFQFLFFCSKKESDDLLKPRKLRIACNLPLTGGLATYGEAIRDGILLSLEDGSYDKTKELNKIEYIFDDNQGTPKNTVSLFQKHLLKDIDVYISAVTPQTMSIIQQVKQKNIPHFAWAWQPFITRDYDNTFRTWVNFEEEAKYFIDFIKEAKPERIAIAHMNVTGPLVQFDSIILPVMKDLGFKDFKREIFNIDKIDFRDIVNKFKKYNPDIILMSGFKGHVISFAKAAREAKIIRTFNTMISMDLLDASEDMSNEALEGLVVTAPSFLITKSKTFIEWEKRFRNRFNRNPRYTDVYAYDLGLILSNVTKVLKTINNDNESIKNILMRTEIDGLTGKLKFKENRDLVLYLEKCYFKDGLLIQFNN